MKKYADLNDSFVSRWGGEEFLMVLRSKDTGEAYSVISAMLDEIRSTEYEFEGQKIKVTMTFGVSKVETGDNAESAVNRADTLLYSGKQAGRNRIVI